MDTNNVHQNRSIFETLLIFTVDSSVTVLNAIRNSIFFGGFLNRMDFYCLEHHYNQHQRLLFKISKIPLSFTITHCCQSVLSAKERHWILTVCVKIPFGIHFECNRQYYICSKCRLLNVKLSSRTSSIFT